MVNIGKGVAAFLFKWILPLVFLAAALVRFNAVSGVYLLFFLLLPLMPNPTHITLRGRTGTYLIAVTVIGALACILQAVWLTVIYTTDFAENLEFCDANESEPLWRQLGFQRLDGIDIWNGIRLVAPDVVVFVLAFFTFLASKKLVAPSEDERQQGVVMERRSQKHNQVVEGIACFITMVLLATAAVIVPSVLSSVYFVSLLVVATWWALYMTWGRAFNVLQLLWLVFCGSHIVLLYVYQFEFFQIAYPYTEFIPRLVGLLAIIKPHCTAPDVTMDPRILAFEKGQIWPIYATPAVLVCFYWYLGLQVKSWIDGPEYVVSPHSPKKKQKKKGRGEHQETPKKGLIDEEQPAGSYQSMGESSSKAAAEADPAPGEEEPTSGDEETDHHGGYKLSPVTTVVAYITQQSYMVALILMMAWSIIFHSVLSFFLLVWALLIWVIPLGTMRGRCLWTSLPLVLYAEALTCITYVYGFRLEEELPSKVNDINLEEIGFIRAKYQCLVLAGEIIFTLMFWLTLRQFLREKRLQRASQHPDGIVLQPFGVIFSQPKDEIEAIHQQESEGVLLQSETMAVVGSHVRRFCSKYWIFVVGAFFLIMTLFGDPDIFKIIYLCFFLILVNLFVFSFTLFRVFSGLICWIVVLYSMVCLVLIYSYQFEYAPDIFVDVTHIDEEIFHALGLQQYDTAKLFLNLLIPVVFILVIMLQLHYFHSEFLKRSEISRSGYSPASVEAAQLASGEASGLPEDDIGMVEFSGRQPENAAEQAADEGAAAEAGEGQEGEEAGTSGDAPDQGAAKKSTKSRMKIWVAAKWKQAKMLYNPATTLLWRFVEIHVAKIVLFAIFFVISHQVNAFNGILLLLVFLAIPFPIFMRPLSLFSLLCVSGIVLAKMVYQIELIQDEVVFPACDNPNVTGSFALRWAEGLLEITSQGNGSTLHWFGVDKVDKFASYVGGYVGIIVIIIAQSVVWLHQEQYRKGNGLEAPKYSIVFLDITREKADEGLLSCFKFFVNYAFYKFGLEICFLFTVIASSVRLDMFGAVFMLLMLMMLFVRRRKVAILWPFYAMVLVVLLLLAFALSLGLPPALCVTYPWSDYLPDRLIEWIYLPDYLNPPTGRYILTDFIQLLLVCLQWQVFRLERRPEGIQGGGDNYEATTDVENIADNPVPNFNIKRTYLNILKIFVFNFSFWVTLAVVFLAGTLRISLLGIIYIVFAFVFLWAGSNFLTKPTAAKLTRWNLLLAYCVLVIIAKIFLQLMTCVYSKDLSSSGNCWVVQLFGVACFQTGYVPIEEECHLPEDSARMTWDIICFVFILFQRRIFNSNYFQYVVLDLEEEGKLSSKGAELINEILATKVRNNRLKEERILDRVKRKMAKIRDRQAKLADSGSWIEPQTHGDAIRGQGGYYMFEDLSDEELSELEEAGILDTEEEGPEGQQTVGQLAFQGLTHDAETALELDDKRKATLKAEQELAGDDDGDAVSYSTAHEDEDREPATEDRDDEPTAEQLQDEIPAGGEAEPEEEAPPPGGAKDKVIVKVKWVWRILMRVLDSIIAWLDEFSKEYRYVHKELRKIKLNAKKQRTTAAPETAVSDGGAAAAEPTDEEGTAKDQAEERGEAKVTIVEPPEVEKSGDGAEGGERKDEVASVTATSTTTKFERSMIRPLRLLYALYYAVISHSELLCFFLIIMNHIIRANLLTLPLVIALFLWALLSIPRPTRRFWIFVLTYEMIIVIYKYMFQFSFYPWNEPSNLEFYSNAPLYPPTFFGMTYSDNFSVLDLILLLSVFFHRSILKSHGLWTESQVVPDLGQNEGRDDEDGEKEDGEAAAAEQQEEAEKKKKKKGKKKKKKKDKKKQKTEEEEEQDGADADTEEGATKVDEEGDDEAKEPKEGDDQGETESEDDEEEESESFFEPFKRFYRQMVDPTFSATTDVYVAIFLLQFIMFIVLALFNHAFGEEKAAGDVTELVESNSIPTSFLILLLIQFFVIVIDRAIYLRKNITGKFIFLVVWVFVIHFWLFFILPPINNKPFTENGPAKWFYFLNCVYFGLSAYQIRCGYPTRILGNFLYKRYSYASLVMYYGWKAIPFLAELRLIMDWVWTDTTLSLFHYAKVEDIYSNIYPDKCFRRNEKNMPTPRGQMQKAAVKYGMGGGMVLGLIFIIWFPLIFMSLANTVSVVNPPALSEIQLAFSGYQPFFTSVAQTSSLQPLSSKEYNELQDEFKDDLEARTFLTLYRKEDFVKVTYSGESGTTWEVSPPSRLAFERDLRSQDDVVMTFIYKFTRITTSELVTPTVGGYQEVVLKMSDPEQAKIREDLAAALNLSTSKPVMLPRLFPSYVRVPLAGEVTVANKIVDDLSNASLQLKTGSIPGLSGTSEWWNLFAQNGTDIKIITLNERSASQLLAPLAGYGVIGLYITIVLVIGKFVRGMFAGISYTIMFDELPNVDRILKLVLDIYLVRESGEMELEEDLTSRLFFLYRSPETLIKVTKDKQD